MTPTTPALDGHVILDSVLFLVWQNPAKTTCTIEYMPEARIVLLRYKYVEARLTQDLDLDLDLETWRTSDI